MSELVHHDVADGITKAGQGSELALMIAKAFEQGMLNASSGRGGMPECWICPIAAPGAKRLAMTMLRVDSVCSAPSPRTIFTCHGSTIVAVPSTTSTPRPV